MITQMAINNRNLQIVAQQSTVSKQKMKIKNPQMLNKVQKAKNVPENIGNDRG